MLPVVLESKFERSLDFLMVPLMYLLQANFSEEPQRTHFWNRSRYKTEYLQTILKSELFLKLPGAENLAPRWFWFLPLLHIPILGGWKDYYVLEPAEQAQDWFVGWVLGPDTDISKVAINGRVRVLKADIDVDFFGVGSNGRQIGLRLVGAGTLGKTTEYAKIPLL